MSRAADVTRREGITALRNAAKLAASLFVTWGLGLWILRELPGYLGVYSWGAYRYGFDLAAALAVFLHLGVDTYVSRELPVRPAHASDFFGGVLVLRALLLLPLFAYGVIELGGKVHEEKIAAALFGATQLFIVTNLTFQQILQAASTVGRLAIANVVTKALWGAGVLAAVFLRAPFWVVPLPMLFTEALKTAILWRATKSAVGLSFRLDLAATRRVLRTALPFYVAIGAVYLGAYLDSVLLRALVPDPNEVGLYSAARDVARLSAILMPVLTGVLVPMMSRAKHRDEDRFTWLLRRGIEGVNVVSIPLTLLLALFPELVISIVVNKPDYLAAASTLRWLAPTFVLAYVNSLLWLALMILDRSWTIAIVSVVGMLLLPLFIVPAVHATAGWGFGGAATGVAIAISARELVIVLVFVTIVGRRAFDRRGLLALLRSLAICGAVVAAHRATPRLGDLRLVTDALLYLVLALALGVVRIQDAATVLRLIKDRKHAQT
jgi:O-antigen/teichoic acid export membrane protein